MKKKSRAPRKSKTKSEDFTSQEGVLQFVEGLFDEKGDIRKRAREKSDGATGGALRQLDGTIKNISAKRAIPDSVLRTVNETSQEVRNAKNSISSLETRMQDVTEQSNKTLGLLGDLAQQFTDYKKDTDKKLKEFQKVLSESGASVGDSTVSDMLGTAADIADMMPDRKSKTVKTTASVSKSSPGLLSRAWGGVKSGVSAAGSGAMRGLSAAASFAGETAMAGVRALDPKLAAGIEKLGSRSVSGNFINRFIQWLSKSGGKALAQKIIAKVGVVAAGAAIPVAGWVMSLVSAGLLIADAVELIGYLLDFIRDEGSLEDDESEASSGKGPRESTSVKQARSQNNSGIASPDAQRQEAESPGMLDRIGQYFGITKPTSTTSSASSGGGGGGGDVNTGGAKYNPGPGSADVESNKKYIAAAMNKYGGSASDEERAAMAAVIAGESGFRLQNEVSYASTPNSRIRSIFGSRVPSDDASLDKLKADPAQFFEHIYGMKDPVGKSLGNDRPGDGVRYLGRGFIQITGRGNYTKYAQITDIDIVSNPELANDPKTAAEIAVKYMMSTRKGGGSVYESIARGVGNPVASTESNKKSAFEAFKKSGEFSKEKTRDTQEPDAKPAAGGDVNPAAGMTPMTAPEGSAAPAPDAVPTEKGVATPGQNYAYPKTPGQGQAQDFSKGYTPAAGESEAKPENIKLESDRVNLSRIDGDLLKKFYAAAKEYGKPVTIASAYRDDAYQAELWARGSLGERGIYTPAKPKEAQEVTIKNGPFAGKRVSVPGGGRGSSHGDGRAIDSPQAADPGFRSILQKFGLAVPFAGDPVHVQKQGDTGDTGGGGGSMAQSAPRGMIPNAEPISRDRSFQQSVFRSSPADTSQQPQGMMIPRGTSRAQIPGPIGMAAGMPGMGPLAGLLSTIAMGGGQAALQQSPIGLIGGALSGLLGALNRPGDTRNPNVAFAPDQLQDNNVPPAMPGALAMKELFDIDLPPGTNPVQYAFG